MSVCTRLILSRGSTLNIVGGSASPASWHMDGVTQEPVDPALYAGETVVLATTHTLSKVPQPRASRLSSGHVWSHEDAQTLQNPHLDHSKASNTIVTDHEDQATLRTLAS